MESAASARLELLRALTECSPSWTVWKSVESAVRGTGDVDSLAPRAEWHAIAETFAAWAARHDLGPVLECRHVPHAVVLVAVERGEPANLVQLDVAEHTLHRGGTLASAQAFASMTRLDARGFRRLRPAAEGVLALLSSGTLFRTLSASETERIAGLLREDPDGVAEAANAVGFLAPAARRAVAAVCAGRSPRRSLLEADLRTLARLVCQPSTLIAVAVFDLMWRRRCPVLAALQAGRCVRGDRHAWLERARADHAVRGVHVDRDKHAERA